MSGFKDYIETLKRLYSKDLVTYQKLAQMKNSEPPKITQEEYEYITGKVVVEGE